MAKNYILSNIQFLLTHNRLSQDEFGSLFGYKKGAFGQMLRRKALPNIETIQAICIEYHLNIDDFVNRPLDNSSLDVVNDPGEKLLPEQSKYVSLLEQSIQDKEEIIAGLRERIARYEGQADKKNAG